MPTSRPPHGAEPAFAVHYVPQSDVSNWLTRENHILGVVSFGAPHLAATYPYLAAPLTPAGSEPQFEIWTAAAPVQPLQTGSVTGRFNDAIAFGAVTLPAYGESLETITERAYLDIFDFLTAAGNKAPIRFWNYLTAITADDRGLERYRRFNIGRQSAFTARLQQRLPPAASGVGGHTGNSVIYFLAAPEPALPIENPRQVSAFDYPAVYGPRSPSFSRAAIFTQNNAACLFISGTASITGHESRHLGDLPGQISETGENLRAVITAASQAATPPLQGKWAVKIYLHNPADQPHVAPIVADLFGSNAELLYLHGDICRRELLVEIEAFRQF